MPWGPEIGQLTLRQEIAVYGTYENTLKITQNSLANRNGRVSDVIEGYQSQTPDVSVSVDCTNDCTILSGLLKRYHCKQST
jgi:hypothetical protein